MRLSRVFLPTLRDAPADAEAVSHKLLVRGGFIRQLQSGHYTLLPFGFRVHEKVKAVIRHEINGIGGQEMSFPVMHPASLWETSGRWSKIGDEMFRLVDRRGADQALAMTHEEAFASVFSELNSYKQLPQLWYQFQTKLRDEPRSKGGLLRVREFVMKDSYSFDLDEAGLDAQFDAHHAAYLRIFRRLGLDPVPVEASSGAMGGSDSVEFMQTSPAGEDDIVRCDGCGYAANMERATSALPDIANTGELESVEKFPTPGVRTIAALEEVDGGTAANNQIKTLVFMLDDELTLVLMRGDHTLVEQKLIDLTGAAALAPAQAESIKAALGASPGSLGAVGVSDLRIIADHALSGRAGMTTGANDDDWHYRGVDVARDIDVGEWADLRGVNAGESCAKCGHELRVERAIEIGHIFKLGRLYTEAFDITVLDQNGKTQRPIMGSYGIGVGRGMAAAVEANHDDNGIIWPVSIAPFEAIITVVKVNDEASMQIAEALYAELSAAGIDVALDDRDQRAGVKFKDAELTGIPFRITIGPKGLEAGDLEVTERATGERRDIAIDATGAEIVRLVEGARAALLA